MDPSTRCNSNMWYIQYHWIYINWNFRKKQKLYSKSEIISGETRTTPGTNADPFYREPDLVTGLENTSQDAMYYQTMLGFDSKEQMAETFVENYTKMIESIKKNMEDFT